MFDLSFELAFNNFRTLWTTRVFPNRITGEIYPLSPGQRVWITCGMCEYVHRFGHSNSSRVRGPIQNHSKSIWLCGHSRRDGRAGLTSRSAEEITVLTPQKARHMEEELACRGGGPDQFI